MDILKTKTREELIKEIVEIGIAEDQLKEKKNKILEELQLSMGEDKKWTEPVEIEGQTAVVIVENPDDSQKTGVDSKKMKKYLLEAQDSDPELYTFMLDILEFDFKKPASTIKEIGKYDPSMAEDITTQKTVKSKVKFKLEKDEDKVAKLLAKE
jgi:hypothetical protein